MLKKSIHIDLFYTELPYERRFAAAKKDGFDAVEFYCAGWENKNLTAIRRLLDENGLEIAAATGATPYSMCAPSQREDYLTCIQKLLKAARVIDCPILMIHSNALEPSESLSETAHPGYFLHDIKTCVDLGSVHTSG